MVTGENPDGSKWKWREHDCEEKFYPDFFPQCIKRVFKPAIDPDKVKSEIFTRVTCSCGKDFCNFGDAKGGKNDGRFPFLKILIILC